jgi:hypothetical protein
MAAATQDQIDMVLKVIKGLLEQIEPLSKHAMNIEAGLVEAQEAYNERLGTLNRKAEELKSRSSFLRYELRLKQGVDLPQLSTSEAQSRQPTSLFRPKIEEALASLQKDPRDKRKRDLADYILDLISDDQQIIMERVNAMVADSHRSVGDMLEALPWGPIWMQRTDGETLNEQLERLEGWHRELEERLTFWQNEVRRLESDRSYCLWQEMQVSSEESWQVYLDELASAQEVENTQLEHAVAILEQELQKGEVSDV